MTDSTRRPVDDLRDLVGALDLREIRCIEVSGRRVWDRPPNTETQTAIAVATRVEDTIFGQRFRMTAATAQADFVVEVESIYRAQEPIAFSIPLGVEFIERVAIMAAFPFLREGVAATAARMEVDVPLVGLLRAGQFKVEVPEEDTANSTPQDAAPEIARESDTDLPSVGE